MENKYMVQIKDYSDGEVYTSIGDAAHVYKTYKLNDDCGIGEIAVFDITDFANPVRINALGFVEAYDKLTVTYTPYIQYTDDMNCYSSCTHENGETCDTFEEADAALREMLKNFPSGMFYRGSGIIVESESLSGFHREERLCGDELEMAREDYGLC